MQNKMSATRANFMLAYEKYVNSRPEKVSRLELLAFMEKMGGTIGPSGQELKFPAWMTNSKQYQAERGSYYLPWDDLDAFLKVNPSATPASKMKSNKKKEDPAIETAEATEAVEVSQTSEIQETV